MVRPLTISDDGTMLMENIPGGNQRVRCTAQTNATNSNALADVTGMSVVLQPGGKYSVRAKLFTVSTATGGLQLGLGGTCTATSLIAEAKAYNAKNSAWSNQATALGLIGGAAGITDSAEAYVQIVVNAGGTLTMQTSQSVATPAETASVKVGSFMVVEQISN